MNPYSLTRGCMVAEVATSYLADRDLDARPGDVSRMLGERHGRPVDVTRW